MTDKKEAEKVIRDTIEYANKEIENTKKKYMKIFFIVFGVFVLVIISYLIIAKYEIPIKYNKGILEVSIPENEGIDIKINLSNYKNANVVLVQTKENAYDLYVNVTQTIVTKLFDDTDKSNNLLRVGNDVIIDFQSEIIKGYIPNGNDAEMIKHIYYMDSLSKEVSTMSENELNNVKNKTLIWERD